MQKQQFEIAVLRNLIQRLPLGPMLEFGALKTHATRFTGRPVSFFSRIHTKTATLQWLFSFQRLQGHVHALHIAGAIDAQYLEAAFFLRPHAW